MPNGGVAVYSSTHLWNRSDITTSLRSFSGSVQVFHNLTSSNHKAFGNVFRNSRKSFHTFARCSSLNNRGYQSFIQLNDGTSIYKIAKVRRRRDCDIYLNQYHIIWVGKMIDSLYYLGQNISQRCENSFVNYRIHYQKHCYSLRRIWTLLVYSWQVNDSLEHMQRRFGTSHPFLELEKV